MDIEKIIRLKDIIMTDDKQYVIINTKRNFLDSRSKLYVKPRFVRLSEIVSTINTEETVWKIDKEITRVADKAVQNEISMPQIEERLIAGILLERERYDELCQRTIGCSNEEVLSTDMITKEDIYPWAIHNIVEVSPYMSKCRSENKSDEKALTYTVVTPTTLVNFKDFCNEMLTLKYRVDLEKGAGGIIKHEGVSQNHRDPYNALCSLLLDNRHIYTNGIYCDYNTEIVLTPSQLNNVITTSPARVRK